MTQLKPIMMQLKGKTTMERPYESAAASVAMSIKRLAAHEDALENLESYLSMHFAVWLKKYANDPDSFAAELHEFSTMYES